MSRTLRCNVRANFLNGAVYLYTLNAKDSMEHLNELHWHDSEIESVIEVPAKDELIYNIQYPENWDKNIFVPKAITFNGYHSHAIEEMPFEGNPTILAVSVVKEEGGFSKANSRSRRAS